MRDFERTRRPAGTACSYRSGDREKRRVCVAVVRFRQNVFFACASCFRKPFLKCGTSREHAAPLARHAVTRMSAVRRDTTTSALEFQHAVHFALRVFLPQTVSEMGILRKHAAPLARHAVTGAATEMRRVGVAVVRFRQNVFSHVRLSSANHF